MNLHWSVNESDSLSDVCEQYVIFKTTSYRSGFYFKHIFISLLYGSSFVNIKYGGEIIVRVSKGYSGSQYYGRGTALKFTSPVCSEASSLAVLLALLIKGVP